MKLFILTGTLALFPSLLLACLHFDVDYKKEIREGTKMALLFHDGKNAHLIVKTDVQVEEGELPKELAWVLPFPSLPKKYEEVEPAVFEELFALMKAEAANSRSKGTRSSGYSTPQAEGIKVHAKETVGNYTIQPIEILAGSAGGELNAWLTKNHFNSMPDALQKQYLKKGAVFLAIRAKLEGNLAHFKPLHIVYASDRLSFPLKFTHETRDFGMRLFVATSKPVAQDPWTDSSLEAKWSVVFSGAKAKSPQLKKLLGTKPRHIHFFSQDRLSGKTLAQLKEDPWVKADGTRTE